MSFSICQLNDALEHASLRQLICVYLEIAVWRWWRRVGGYCTCSFQIGQLGSSRAGAAMMDSGWLGEVQSRLGLLWCPKALSRQQTSQPTVQTRPPPPPLLIYSLFLWVMCWQPGASQNCDEQDIVVKREEVLYSPLGFPLTLESGQWMILRRVGEEKEEGA